MATRGEPINQRSRQIPDMVDREGNPVTIHAVEVDGAWWYALNPLCDGLWLNVRDQRDNLGKHRVLGPLLQYQRVRFEKGGVQRTACLHERAIAFWLGMIPLGQVNPRAAEKLLVLQELLVDMAHRATGGEATALLLPPSTGLGGVEISRTELGRIVYKNRTLAQWLDDVEGFADLTHRRLGDVEQRITDVESEEGTDDR